VPDAGRELFSLTRALGARRARAPSSLTHASCRRGCCDALGIPTQGSDDLFGLAALDLARELAEGTDRAYAASAAIGNAKGNNA